MLRSRLGFSIGLAAVALALLAGLSIGPRQVSYAQGPGMPPLGGDLSGLPIPSDTDIGALAAQAGLGPAAGADADAGMPVFVWGGATNVPTAPIYMSRPEVQERIAKEMERLGREAMPNIPRYYHEMLRQEDFLVQARGDAIAAYISNLDDARERQAEALRNKDFQLADQYAVIADWLASELGRMEQDPPPYEITSSYYGTHTWWQGRYPPSPRMADGNSSFHAATDQQRTRRTFQSAHVGSAAPGAGGGMGGMMGMGGPGGMMGGPGGSGMMGPGMMGSGGGMMGSGGPGGPGGPGTGGLVGAGMTGPGGGR